MQVIHHSLVWLLPEERPVSVHAVASQEPDTFLGNVTSNVGEETISCLLRSHCRLDDGRSEAALAVYIRPILSVAFSPRQVLRLVAWQQADGTA